MTAVGQEPRATARGAAPRRALVVGAGLGGLASAVRLAHEGWDVTVLERHATPGGRCGVWESEGFRFDMGPTLLLMLPHLERLFADTGRRLEDYLTLVQLDPNYRVHYADGSTLEVTSRLNQMLANAERIEPGVSGRFLGFLSRAGELFRLGEAFVDRNVHDRRDFFTLKDAGLLAASGAFGTLRRFVSRHLRDERLRQAFSFQSLYLGLSPYEAMAIYALLPYTEVAGGLFFPMGGMHALPEALERLGRELGVRYRYGADVADVEHDGATASGVRLAGGERLAADLVLVNADLPWAYRHLLGERVERHERMQYSCSAFLIYLGVEGTYPQLLHHNLVVPADLRTACDDIFHRHRIPDDPAFYVCNPNKTDPSLAPRGTENIYVLVPVPSQHPERPIDWSVAGPALEDRMLDRLEAFGLTGIRQRLLTRRTFTPEDFRVTLSATRSEAFGLSHGLTQVGYFRPQNRHATIGNLFFVGQSTHPGCGIPMAMISARCAVERIVAEQGAGVAG